VLFAERKALKANQTPPGVRHLGTGRQQGLRSEGIDPVRGRRE
jgi:hypothetical protein